MSDHALSQVEDRIVAILTAYAPLTGQTVQVSESLDIAIEDIALPGIVITTTSYTVDQFDENSSSIHTAVIDIEAITATPATGTISRANRNTLALIHAALSTDRTLGIKLQDIQEEDIAPVEPRGKDVDGAAVRYRVIFFTSRTDWFTII